MKNDLRQAVNAAIIFELTSALDVENTISAIKDVYLDSHNRYSDEVIERALRQVISEIEARL